ncbi:MAG: DUF5915 domain-containing protein, partial [Lentisphaerota bacterium]
PESVHLCDFPVADGTRRDLDLEAQMELVMAVVGMGRQLRADYDLKVRQPLAGMHVICRDTAKTARLQALQELVKEELNVHQIWFGHHEKDLAELSGKANFSRLGPRLGAQVKKAAGVIAKLTTDQLGDLLDGKKVQVQIEGLAMDLEPEDVIIERKPKEGLAVASEGDVVVALESRLTPDLVREGLAREFVNKVQSMRKTADFDVTQRITLNVTGGPELQAAIKEHHTYIENETLCISCAWFEKAGLEAIEWDLNGHACLMEMKKA